MEHRNSYQASVALKMDIKLALFAFMVLWTFPALEGNHHQAKPLKTTVHYRAEVVCRRTPFCAFAEYFELDTFREEYLKFVPLHCTNGNVLIHEVKFTLQDGDGFWDWNYEPTVQIFHDCYGQGDIRFSEVQLWRVNEKEVTHNKAYAVEIDDRAYQVCRYRLQHYQKWYGFERDADMEDWISGGNIYNRTHMFKQVYVGGVTPGEFVATP